MTDDEIREKFESVNIDILIESIFPKSLSDDDFVTTAHEVDRLCNLISVNFKKQLWGYPVLNEKLKLYLTQSPGLKRELRKHCNGDLDHTYLPAMLSIETTKVSFSQTEFDLYKALVLLMSVHLILQGKAKSSVFNVCNELRHYAEGRRNEFIKYLPPLESIDSLFGVLNEFESELEWLQGKFPKYGSFNKAPPDSKKLAESLSRYKVPISYCCATSKPIEKRGRSKSNGKHRKIKTKAADLFEIEEDQPIAVEVLRPSVTFPDKWYQEDNTGEDGILVSMRLKVRSNLHYGHAAIQTQAVAANLVKQKRHSPCNINAATEFEIKMLLRQCESYFKTPASLAHDIAQILVLMLFLGNTAEQILSSKYIKKSGIVFLSRVYLTASQKQRPIVDKYLCPVRHSFEIFCFTCLDQANFLVSKENDIANFLGTLNRRYETKLTVNKIIGFMRHHHKNIGVSSSISQIISDPNVQKLPALSYLQTPLSEVSRILDQYIDYLDTIEPTKHIEKPYIMTARSDKHKNNFIGSKLSVPKNILVMLIKKLKIRLSLISSSTDQLFSIEGHDLIVSYTQIVLALSSGGRPVTGWLGQVSDINFISGEYYLDDKDSLNIGSGRTVILPPLSLKVVEQYLKFIKAAASHFKGKDAKLSLRYQNVINAKEHLFFYRYGPTQDAPFYECGLNEIIHQLDYFPLPPNWHRHHIRTILESSVIEDDVIDAWMGHTAIGQTALSQFSGIGVEDLREISAVIGDFLDDISVKEIFYV